MHSGNIELAIANYYDFRQNMIVPNVGYGLGIHECDLLIVRKSGYAIEVEIKISIADLKADFNKTHGHRSTKIKYLYYAIPEKLKEKALPLIPENAGLFIIKEESNYVICVKPAIQNKSARKLSVEEIEQLGRLATMRIWNLKRTNHSLSEQNQKLRGR